MLEKRFKSYKDELRNVFIGYALIPIIVVSIIVFILIFIMSYQAIKVQNLDDNNDIINHVENSILPYLDEVENLKKIDDMYDVVVYRKNLDKMYEYLYDFINKQKVKLNFYVLDKTGVILMGSTKAPPSYVENMDMHMWGVLRDMETNSDETVFVLNKTNVNDVREVIFSIGSAVIIDNKVEGFIIFDISNHQLFRLNDKSLLNDIVVTDKFYNIAYTNNTVYSDSISKLIREFRGIEGFSKIGKSSYFIGRNHSEKLKLDIYTISKLTIYNQVFLVGGIFLAALFLFLILTMYHFANVIANNKTKSIDTILRAINSAQEGNLNSMISLETNDEFEIIAHSYNEMMMQINELIKLNKESVERNALTEIKQLESQFNPHFLFNSLETIRCMMKFDTKAANEIILNLSALLRYSIANQFEEINLERDIEYLNNYLSILKFRFGEKINYEISMMPGTEKCTVPKLMIQPIIENSVKHGWSENNKLNIKINIYFEGDSLVTVISDNGNGMSNQKVKEINNILSGTENKTEHIGLYNIQRRIQLMYGSNYGIIVCSEENIGTTTRIHIPIFKECFSDDKSSNSRK